MVSPSDVTIPPSLPLLPFTAVPNISMPTASQQFQTNEMTNITITCTVSGFPAPSISFQRGIEDLTNTASVGSVGQTLAERVQVGMEETMLNVDGLYVVTRDLTLFHADDGDTGEFTCTASAGDRSDKVAFELTVQSMCRCTTMFNLKLIY